MLGRRKPFQERSLFKSLFFRHEKNTRFIKVFSTKNRAGRRLWVFYAAVRSLEFSASAHDDRRSSSALSMPLGMESVKSFKKIPKHRPGAGYHNRPCLFALTCCSRLVLERCLIQIVCREVNCCGQPHFLNKGALFRTTKQALPRVIGMKTE